MDPFPVILRQERQHFFTFLLLFSEVMFGPEGGPAEFPCFKSCPSVAKALCLSHTPTQRTVCAEHTVFAKNNSKKSDITVAVVVGDIVPPFRTELLASMHDRCVYQNRTLPEIAISIFTRSSMLHAVQLPALSGQSSTLNHWTFDSKIWASKCLSVENFVSMTKSNFSFRRQVGQSPWASLLRLTLASPSAGWKTAQGFPAGPSLI